MVMRICSGVGCGRITQEDTRYCAECAVEHKTDTPKLSRWERAKTDPIMAQFSTSRWNKFRPQVLQRYPFCAVCKSQASKVADHKIPARLIVAVCNAERLFVFDTWAGFYLLANMQGLCHSCHNAKTRVEDSMDWTAELDAVLAPYRSERKAKTGEQEGEGKANAL